MDAHRTESLVISPYTQRSEPFVDHTLYDTAALVRTIGLILGTNPLSQYDANAVPMWWLFHAGVDLKPYQALTDGVGTAALNTSDSFGAALSATWNFNTEDQAPMDQLNQVLWGAVKDPNVPYPGPAASQPALDN